MDDKDFRKTEAQLYGYYETLLRMEKLLHIEGHIKQQIQDSYTYDYDNHLLTSSGLVSSYQVREEGRKSVRSNSSSIETAFFILEEEREKMLKNKVNIRRRIIELENKAQHMKWVVSQLDERERMFVELRYRDKLSLEDIAESLHYEGHSGVRKLRPKIVEKVFRLVNLK